MSSTSSGSDPIQVLLNERPLNLDVLLTAGIYHWERYCNALDFAEGAENLALALRALRPYFLCATSALDLPIELLWLLSESIDDPIASLAEIGVEVELLGSTDIAMIRWLMSRTTFSLSPKWLPRLADFGKACISCFEQIGDPLILDFLSDHLNLAVEEVDETYPFYFHVLRITAEAANWRWRTTRKETDLDPAIERLREAIRHLDRERADHRDFASGFQAAMISLALEKTESGSVEEGQALALEAHELSAICRSLDREEQASGQLLLKEIAETLENVKEEPNPIVRYRLWRQFVLRALEDHDIDAEQRSELYCKLGWGGLQVSDPDEGDLSLDEVITLFEQAMLAATNLDSRDKAARLMAGALYRRSRLMDDPADLDRAQALLNEIRWNGAIGKPALEKESSDLSAARRTLDEMIVPASVFDPLSCDRMGLRQVETDTVARLFCEFDLDPRMNPGMSAELGVALREFQSLIKGSGIDSPYTSALPRFELMLNECPRESPDHHEIENIVLGVKSSAMAESQNVEGLREVLADMQRHLSSSSSSALRRVRGMERMAELVCHWYLLETRRPSGVEMELTSKSFALQLLQDIEGVCTNETVPVSTRIEAVQSASRLAAVIGRPDAVTGALSLAVQLLSRVASLHLRPEGRLKLVSRYTGIASDASALTLARSEGAHADETALQLLEIGRNVLHNQTLAVRPDLTALRKAAPDLASRYEEVTVLLDNDDAVRESGFEPVGRHDHAEELKRLVSRIQIVEGHASFGRAPLVSELRAEAQSGPIICLNMSDLGNHALIVSAQGIERVAIQADLNLQAVGYVSQFVKSIEVLASGSDFSLQQKAEAGIKQVLTWAHNAITGPILDRLGFTTQQPESCPRVWWVPGGLLSLLPLHAAGDYTLKRPIITADRVISSFTPSIRQLGIHAPTADTLSRSKALLLRCNPPQGASIRYWKPSLMRLTYSELGIRRFSRKRICSWMTEQSGKRSSTACAAALSLISHATPRQRQPILQQAE